MFTSKSGKGFTNRPAAKAEDARHDAAQHSKTPSMVDKSAHSEPEHETVTCPSCGSSFELHPTGGNDHDADDSF